MSDVKPGVSLRPRRWGQIAAALALVLLLAAGAIVVWARHGESAAKAMLAAEIRGDRAALAMSKDPSPSVEEAETAHLYLDAFSKVKLEFADVAFFEAIDRVPWSAVPSCVTDVLAANAEALAILDEAAGRSACRFDDTTGSTWSRHSIVQNLVLARGHAELSRGRPVEAANDVRRLLRLGRDFAAAPWDWEECRPWPGLQLIQAEQKAAELLSAVATAPGLPPETGAALMAAVRSPWGTSDAIRRSIDAHEWAVDSYFLRLLAPDAEDWLGRLGLLANSLNTLVQVDCRELKRLDRTSERIPECLAVGARIPTADGIRWLREQRAPIVAALRRRDMTALAPGGPHDEIGGLFGFLGPHWFRHSVANEARIAVARAAAAVRAFQLAEAKPPRRLADLVPSLLPDVPVDPFDEKPLAYEVDGNGWRVSSRVWSDTWKRGDGIEKACPPAEVRMSQTTK